MSKLQNTHSTKVGIVSGSSLKLEFLTQGMQNNARPNTHRHVVHHTRIKRRKRQVTTSQRPSTWLSHRRLSSMARASVQLFRCSRVNGPSQARKKSSNSRIRHLHEYADESLALAVTSIKQAYRSKYWKSPTGQSAEADPQSQSES